MNIKLEYFHDKTVRAFLQVLPIRPCNITEKKLGKIVAEKTPDYHVVTGGMIYKQMDFVDHSCTVIELYEKATEAQEDFSKRIHRLKAKLEEFKLLKEIAEDKEDSK